MVVVVVVVVVEDVVVVEVADDSVVALPPSMIILPGLMVALNSSLLKPSSTTWNLEKFHSYSPGTAFSGILKLRTITGSSSFTGVGSPEERVEQ